MVGFFFKPSKKKLYCPILFTNGYLFEEKKIPLPKPLSMQKEKTIFDPEGHIKRGYTLDIEGK